jgi:lauroyl/myristoyl acyltransferase
MPDYFVLTPVYIVAQMGKTGAKRLLPLSKKRMLTAEVSLRLIFLPGINRKSIVGVYCLAV